MKAAVYAVTEKGAALGRAIAETLESRLFVLRRFAQDGAEPFDSLPECIARNYEIFAGHIFITAAGIAVRCIAPHLTNKTKDPAVVVLDQQGKFVVSLLSGHLGGANALAEGVAEITGGAAVITTATDGEGVPAIDMLAKENGLAIADPARIAGVNAAFLERRPVPLHDPDNALGARQSECFAVMEGLDATPKQSWVAVTTDSTVLAELQGDPHVLILVPRRVVVGVGCRRGTPTEEILAAVNAALEEAKIAQPAVKLLASIDAKADEPGLLEAAKRLGVELVTFAPEELSAMDVPSPSATVRKHMGVDGVCEAAAMRAAKTKTLLLPKRVHGRVTTALAVEKRKS